VIQFVGSLTVDFTFENTVVTPFTTTLIVASTTSVDTVAFWAKYGIDWKSSQREIDFDTVDPDTLMLLVDNNVMYGVKLPSTISSPSAALSK
jgi:hypothetical protein